MLVGARGTEQEGLWALLEPCRGVPKAGHGEVTQQLAAPGGSHAHTPSFIIKSLPVWMSSWSELGSDRSYLITDQGRDSRRRNPKELEQQKSTWTYFRDKLVPADAAGVLALTSERFK